MDSTREQILSTAEAWVRTSGYAGFSYADLSESVGIRKASIHHHFPTKENLAVALVDRYQREFSRALEALSETHRDAVSKLRGYADLYFAGLREGRACLCGMLASDYALVPQRVQIGVQGFFASSIEWLERVITQAHDEGAIASNRDAGLEARVFHATILGAMFAARVRSDLPEFTRVSESALRGLLATNA